MNTYTTLRNGLIAVFFVIVPLVGYDIARTIPTIKAVEIAPTPAVVEFKATPTPKTIVTTVVKEVVVDKGDKLDEMVDAKAKKYGRGKDNYSKLKAITHCLLYFESKHMNALGQGDNGKASGPLQFHEPTYKAYRKIMMDRDLVTYVGDRDNMEDAVETTMWALTDGRGKAWGPILRGECPNF